MTIKKPLFLFALLLVGVGCSQLQEATPTVQVVPTPLVPTPIVVVATPTPLSDVDLAPIDVEEQLITNLYERISPAVVHVTARIITMDFFFGPSASEGTGSGFVVDGSGHIVTNNHVIEGADSIEVIFSDESRAPAEEGVLVAQLYRNGPAALAGIRGANQEVIIGNRRLLAGGDLITAINGRPIKDWIDYLEYLELNTEVGDTIVLTVIRGNVELELEVMVIAQP